MRQPLKYEHAYRRSQFPYHHKVDLNRAKKDRPPEPQGFRLGQIMPLSWWLDKAVELGIQECQKCHGWAQGQYHAPTSAVGECSVSVDCMMCGSSRLVVGGRLGMPYMMFLK